MTDSPVESSPEALASPGAAADEYYMRRALIAAAEAAEHGEVPVGAVLVSAEGQIVAEAGNRQIGSSDPSAHAEILALRAGGQALGNYRLPGSTLFVTLEPCTMCCGALIHGRLSRLVFATREPKAGAVVSTATVLENPALNHRVAWHEGVLAQESADLLKQFFAARRR